MSSKVRLVIVAFMLIFAVSIFSFVPFTQTSHVLASSNLSHVVNEHGSHVESASFPTQGTFNIINDKSNLCIGIAPGQNYAGDWACNSNNDQIWQWRSGSCNAYGYCQLINKNNACLGVYQASTQAGARIVAWACNTNYDQLWALGGCTTDVFLLNFNSGLVIGVLNGSTQNGAELIQWQYNTNLDQCWR